MNEKSTYYRIYRVIYAGVDIHSAFIKLIRLNSPYAAIVQMRFLVPKSSEKNW